jgi:hypothetical protein
VLAASILAIASTSSIWAADVDERGIQARLALRDGQH